MSGDVVKKGSPTKTTMSAERGTTTRSYKPESIETGHPAYGKPGGGTDKEMRSLIADAQAKKRDVTEYSSKGLHYKAGTTTTKETPPKFSTKTDVNPTIRKIEDKKVPLYEKASGSSMKGKLKARAVTKGGEDKKGSPATKYGIGKRKKTIIRKVVSHPKY